jgi:hypothetical protein
MDRHDIRQERLQFRPSFRDPTTIEIETTSTTGDRYPVDEPIETTRKFSKICKMILKLRKPAFDSAEVVVTTSERSAAFRGELSVIVPLNEKYPRPSRLRNARSKSCRFSLRICDRRTHDDLDQTKPTLIGFPVALRRAKAETMAGHHALPNVNDMPQSLLKEPSS